MLLSYSLAFASRLFAILSVLIAGVLSLKIYDRYLTPEVYGVVVVGLNILHYLPYLDGGFRTVLNRALLVEKSATNGRDELVRFGQTLYTRLGLLAIPVAMIVMSAYAFLPKAADAGLPMTFFLALGGVGAATVFSTAQTGLLLGLNAQAGMHFLRGLATLASLGSLWMMMLAGLNFWSFPGSMTVAILLTLPVAMWMIRRIAPGTFFFRWSGGPGFRDHFRRFKTDAFACFRMEAATIVLYTMDLVLVLAICGPVVAGAYGIAKRLFTMLQGIIQSSSEVAWPFIARSGNAGSGLSIALVRVNAWIYGAAIGTLVSVYDPFLSWYMSDAWVSGPAVIVLLGARHLITGLASTVTYLLYGLGEFGALSRYTIRELIAALILECIVGWLWGVEGLLAGFVAASVFGTLFPIIRVYISKMNWSATSFLLHMWTRALIAAGASLLVCRYGLAEFGGGAVTVAVAAAGGIAGIAPGVVLGILRGGRSLEIRTPANRLRQLLLNM